MKNNQCLNMNPRANDKAIVKGNKYRFSILTSRLVRMEYDEAGIFNDECTQLAICRNMPVPEFKVVDTENKLEILTDDLHIFYNKKSFSADGLSITLNKSFSINAPVWHYGQKCDNLKGTARTLDNADGEIELSDGVISTQGYTVLDDSESSIIKEDGWVVGRDRMAQDLYYFGYGHDYLACLKAFYTLTGQTPLLPRFVFGNWWSRFYPYKQDEYIELMERFQTENIPIAVSVIDMDWHKTSVPEKYGSGWTGYSWNRDLYPDPKGLLDTLHKMGKKVTLNLHPADGVRAFEDDYLPMAKALEMDYENEEAIPFDVTNKDFMEAYFKYLHHPKEDEGVDFWWVDWQQGTTSRVPGLDPLFMLNHLHFLDSGRNNKRPLTFSRYAGPGSHRYPIGFSGDTVSSWESLDFQPYFTANASNIGFGWWSHDIGGHQKGIKDDELASRWLQFGVFSPIMRLHSTANEFYGKEPWNYNMKSCSVMTQFMILRHKLVPYLYTMNYRASEEGIPLIMPMYYFHDEKEAYQVPNEYYFGDLIVAPITKKASNETKYSECDVWLPEGMYYDFFTGMKYKGGKRLKVYRNIDSIPVFAREGSIIPMAGDYMNVCDENPKELELIVFTGDNGSFRLIEDDCSNTKNSNKAYTLISFNNDGDRSLAVRIEDPDGVVPCDRSYRIKFRGVADSIDVTCRDKTGAEVPVSTVYNRKLCELTVIVDGSEALKDGFNLICDKWLSALPNKLNLLREMLQGAYMEYDTKEKIFNAVKNNNIDAKVAEQLHEIGLKSDTFGTILDILTSDI